MGHAFICMVTKETPHSPYVSKMGYLKPTNYYPIRRNLMLGPSCIRKHCQTNMILNKQQKLICKCCHTAQP